MNTARANVHGERRHSALSRLDRHATVAKSQLVEFESRGVVLIVGDDSAVNKMAENDRRSRRYSGLKWRLRKGGEEK